MERFHPLLDRLGVTAAAALPGLPGGTDVLIAGVRRVTSTPPMRSGGPVIFVRLDDGTGAVANMVFFHDAQKRVGGRVFATHYLPVRGRTRRSGAKGVPVTGENLWDLLEVARQSQPDKRQPDQRHQTRGNRPEVAGSEWPWRAHHARRLTEGAVLSAD